MKNKHIFFSTVSFLTVFSFLLIFFSGCSNEQGNKKDNENSKDTEISETNTNSSATFLAIKRPFETINKNESTEGIHIENPMEASSYTTASGTILNIPANAFVDEGGNLITSPIDIEYREIKTATEIISSGIPMKMIDENGETQWMQTAGMFEIQGFQNDKPISIAAEKSIKIDFVSTADGEYDSWYFDEEKGNWIKTGTSSISNTETSLAARVETQNEVSRLRILTKTKPFEPRNDKYNKLIFNDLNLDGCPELKGKKEVVLSYIGSDPKQAPKNNKWINKPGIWHKKILKPTNKPATYQLTLLGEKMYQIEVKLALSALEIDKENADYQKRLTAYRENMAALRDKEKILQNQAQFRRLMNVQGFGVYNYDVLWKRSNAIALYADFDFGGTPDAVKRMVTVYLITDNDKTIIGLPYNDWSRFRFVPSQKNKLLAVLPNNKTAIFTNADFIKEKENLMEAEGDSYVFSMDKEFRTVNSKEDLQTMLAQADN